MIIAFGLAVFAQLTLRDQWLPAWLTIPIVVGPIALGFAAPVLAPRCAGEPPIDARRAWWRVAPLLFNPWVFATIAALLWNWTPWHRLGSPPRPGETVQSLRSLYHGVYAMGVAVTSLGLLYAWIRSGVLVQNGVLTAFGVVILLLTSIGGCLVYITPI